MNLYSKMKNLENKYIDLANFYKQELVKSASKTPKDPLKLEKHNRSQGVSAISPRSMAAEANTNPRLTDRSDHAPGGLNSAR